MSGSEWVRWVLQAWALWMPAERYQKAARLLTQKMHEGKDIETASTEAERESEEE